MKVLIACDKFKGSLSATEAAEAIARGLGRGFEIEQCPIADGGEGFVDAMQIAMGGEERKCSSVDALGREISARYALCGDTAVIEMAHASGLWRIAEDERDIMRASTIGTGLLIRDALTQGVSKILLGLGGSATNDGGAGMASELGWRFLSENGAPLEVPHPEALSHLGSIDGSSAMPLPEIEVACDVENPLLGPRGATAIYGPQKGAGPEELIQLESILTRLRDLAGQPDHSEVPGAGAAGGLGWGLLKFANATLRPGFDIVADSVNLRQRIAAADIVITGEGSLDAQSLEGKGPIGVARLAREQGKRTVAVAGQITPEVEDCGLFDFTCSLVATGVPIPELLASPIPYLERETRTLAGMLIG
jgi:glycerate kinase